MKKWPYELCTKALRGATMAPDLRPDTEHGPIIMINHHVIGIM